MITLEAFNQLNINEAVALLESCVAIPDWARQVTARRPYGNRAALLATGQQAMTGWQVEELTLALRAHPRIGEQAGSTRRHADFSRQEQAAISTENLSLAAALRIGNSRYEDTFGRIFLIRANDRSGEEILQILQRRLQNSEQQEIEETLEQLRQITLLRLEGIIRA